MYMYIYIFIDIHKYIGYPIYSLKGYIGGPSSLTPYSELARSIEALLQYGADKASHLGEHPKPETRNRTP